MSESPGDCGPIGPSARGLKGVGDLILCMRRYLAKSTVGAADADPRPELMRLAQAAHEAGIRAMETFWSASSGSAYTLFEAPSEGEVVAAHARAGLSRPEVIEAERIHTDLLDAPRRSR